MTVPDHDPTDTRILELRRTGMSTYAIADEVGMSQSNVHRRLTKLSEEMARENAEARSRQRMKVLRIAAWSLALACLVVIAAGVASLAW